jgi:transposase
MQPLELRALTRDERASLERLAHSRTAPARAVERARIVWEAHAGATAGEIAGRRGVDPQTVRRRLKRFNAQGVAGLEDRPRAGRPPTYPPEQVAEVIAAALTKPETLGLAFASWTLDRLAAYLAEQQGIAMKRTRLDEVLRAEGLRWRKHETRFGERVDREFAAIGKRGVIERRYTDPPEGSVALCLDELGPGSAKGFAGRAPVRAAAADQPSQRARQEIDYGRRSTTGGVGGATPSGRSGRRPARP